MSDLGVIETPIIEAVPNNVGEAYEKLFIPLVQTAVAQLEWLMLNSEDEKIVVSTCKDVLDRAGATKKPERDMAPVIEIRDSDVRLMVQAAKEATTYDRHEHYNQSDDS